MLPDCEGGNSLRDLLFQVRMWKSLLERTELVSHLAGLCFDTTASNKGVHRGAILSPKRLSIGGA